MSEKHTPGPWVVLVDDCGLLAGRPGIFAPDDLDCMVVHWDGFVQEFWRSARGDKEIQANARLIAAAPELLEDLKWAVSCLHFDEDDMPDAAARLKKAKANIAKATGASIE